MTDSARSGSTPAENRWVSLSPDSHGCCAGDRATAVPVTLNRSVGAPHWRP